MCEAAVLMQMVTGWMSKDSTLNEKPGEKAANNSDHSKTPELGVGERSPGHTFPRVT